MFHYSKSLAHLASKLIFTENNRWVPLLLSNSNKLSDLIITKLENVLLNLALLNKHFCTFTCCCQIVTSLNKMKYTYNILRTYMKYTALGIL